MPYIQPMFIEQMAPKLPVGGLDTFYNNAFDPTDIYVHSYTLVNQRESLLNQINIDGTAISVIDGFKTTSSPQSASVIKYLLVFAGILLANWKIFRSSRIQIFHKYNTWSAITLVRSLMWMVIVSLIIKGTLLINCFLEKIDQILIHLVFWFHQVVDADLIKEFVNVQLENGPEWPEGAIHWVCAQG